MNNMFAPSKCLLLISFFYLMVEGRRHVKIEEQYRKVTFLVKFTYFDERCFKDIFLPVFLNRKGFDLIVQDDSDVDDDRMSYTIKSGFTKDKSGFWALRG